MRALWILVACGAAMAQSALKDRVLILVNDKSPASVSVGQYYAAKRGIPAGNIFHLKTTAEEALPMEEYKSQIEGPLRKYFDAEGGAMKRKILYIVPTYGVPVRIAQQFAVDSVLSYMYVGHEDQKPPLKNAYAQAVGSRPPHFDAWSDGPAAANNFKMFIVTRLDGPTPEIAKGIVDKAIEAERTLTKKSGIAYFDRQGTRHPDEWQFAVDNEIGAAAELSRKAGFETVLNVQWTAPCGSMIPAASSYGYDAAKKQAGIWTPGTTAGAEFPIASTAEADFTMAVADGAPQNTGNTLTVQLGSNDKNYVRLVYPFVPFKGHDRQVDMVLEKVVNGTATARSVVRVTGDEKPMNNFASLRISVRKGRIAAYRDQTEIASAEDKSAAPLAMDKASFTSLCWCFGVKRLTVADAAGAKLWDDDFAADSTARYTWHTSPMGGLRALWVWGWYGMATDSYRFVTGGVGAQLTSFTALSIRTPNNPDPKMYSAGANRWQGNWVPRMLEEGVTATWGAVTEPYATFYAPGGNVFDHLWAGYNFGESFYIAQNALRWVMVAVGDPLYSPKFGN